MDGAGASAGRLLHAPRRGEWLRETLDEARERAYAGAKRTDATFAEAAREWLRYVEQDRACKPSTLRSYRSTLEAQLLPARLRGDAVARDRAGTHRALARRPGRIPRTKNQLMTELHGVFRRAQKVYLTAAFTGLRRGELIALRRRHVDLPAARIRVSRSTASGSPPREGFPARIASMSAVAPG